MLNIFSENDVIMSKKLAHYLAKMKIELTASEFTDFYKALVWYDSLLKKIEEYKCEIKKVVTEEEQKQPSPELVQKNKKTKN